MKFFTDKTVKNPWLLIKIKDYIKLRKKGEDFSRWKEVLIDPGVYELKKIPERYREKIQYSWEKDVDILEFLDSLPKNHYFSADYPCDMNPYFTEQFLDLSWTNALKYCSHPQYIITVQFKFNNYQSYIRWFNRYNKLTIASGIIALGNLCRILQLNDFMKYILRYTFKNCKHKRIHIYGLCLRAIPYAEKLSKIYKVDLSVDSTKWTRAVHSELKKECGISCNSKNRERFFNEYLKIIKKRGVTLE